MAPSRPFPIGKASVHFWAGLVYQSLRLSGDSFAEEKWAHVKVRIRNRRKGFIFIGLWLSSANENSHFKDFAVKICFRERQQGIKTI